MAHFYSIAKGGRGKPATKSGNKLSGLETITATWGHAIRTRLENFNGVDHCTIDLIDWPSGNYIRTIYAGPVHSMIGQAHVGDIKPGTGKGE